VTAAIHNKYRDSPLFSKLLIFKCEGAAEFFNAWPVAVEAKAAELTPEITLQAAFSEMATQSVFWAVASGRNGWRKC
jgi:hypothetical protein